LSVSERRGLFRVGCRVLYGRIFPGEEHAFVSAVAPTHPVRRAPVRPLDVENDCVTNGFSDVVASHNDLVSNGGSDLVSPPVGVGIPTMGTRYAACQRGDRVLRHLRAGFIPSEEHGDASQVVDGAADLVDAGVPL